MKTTAVMISILCFANLASAHAGSDYKATGCKVLKMTSYAKTSAMDITYTTAVVSCKGLANFEVHSVFPLIGQILASARASGHLLEINYRNFASSFDGTNGLIVSVTE